ncbi:hypothetical protein LXL04_029998 [Taraxacum kok-saghyz]
MELNFDTELMKVANEFANFDILKPKDRPGPHFRTQETDSIFILSVQLKDYRQVNLKVERNKDGSVITIHGEKPVQGILMIAGKVVKKDIEMHGFRKSFKVPQGVVLDKVKARFNEGKSELIIQIPKATKGFLGIQIEELNTKEIPSESTLLIPVYANGELSEQETELENVQEFSKNVEVGQDKEKRKDQVETNNGDSKANGSEKPKLPERGFKICTPVVFGSTFFVSLIVLVFRFIQSKKSKQQKNTEVD